MLNRRNAVFSHPRATVVSLRSMELFRSWGLEPEIWAGGDEVEWRMLAAPTLSEAAAGSVIEVGYPTRSESAVLSPTRPAAVPQDHLETVLLQHLRGPSGCAVLSSESQSRMSGRRPTGCASSYVTGDADESSRPGPVRDRCGRRAQRSAAAAGNRRLHTEDLLEAHSVVIRAPLWEVLGRHRYGIYVTELPLPAAFSLRVRGPLALRFRLGSSSGRHGRLS